MSYNNNWVKNLSESYINNNRPTNLQEQLDEQVELNEQLMNLIEALCEELDIDVEALLEMAQTKGREREMLGKIDDATTAYHAEKPGSEKNLQNLLKKDALERESPHLFVKGGKRRGRGTAPTPSRRSRRT